MKNFKTDLYNIYLQVRFTFYRLFDKLECKPSTDTDTTFEDNFVAFDASKWNISGAYAPCDTRDSGVYYDPDLVNVKDGVLSLGVSTVPKDFVWDNWGTTPPTEYHLMGRIGIVGNAGKFEQKYGKFEILAKIPKGTGYYPAYWFISLVSWPPEIDMFEFMYEKNHKMASGTYVMKDGKTIGNGHGLFDIRAGRVTLPKNVVDTFNKYTLVWKPDVLEFYFNDILFFVKTMEADLVKDPMYFVLNNGRQAKLECDCKSTFDIKYVKAWKNK